MNRAFFRKRGARKKAEIVVPPVVNPADMDEEQRQMLRSAAQLELQTSTAMRDRVLVEMAASLRWVQASLLLVNGGAAVAVLQSEAVPAHIRTLSGAIFVFGITLSLFTAAFGVSLMSDAPKKLTQAAGYWLGVAVDLWRVESIERQWQEYAIELEGRARLPKMLGYAAAVCFVLGSLVVGVGIF